MAKAQTIKKLLLQAGYDSGRLLAIIKKLRKIKQPIKQREKAKKIAIIGIGCRFPPNITSSEEFWTVLNQGGTVIKNFPFSRLNLNNFKGVNTDEKYEDKGAFLEDVFSFDPLFFGVSPREALEIDPQYRILMEVIWETLENSAIPLEQAQEKRTSLFIGLGTDDYNHFIFQKENFHRFNNYSLLGTNRGVGIGRISYSFGFTGPSLAIDTTCSSSLVAVHYAVQSLLSNESDLAFAGGINLILSPYNVLGRRFLGVLSKRGICQTFDDNADGFVQGEGCGIVLLKRFEDALRDNDYIYSVICSSSVNQNGGSNGLQAPNGIAQKKLLEDTLKKANLTPLDIDYIETHGTATKLGDPIEIEAISQIYKEEREKPLLIGSIKAAYGHLEPAAGILSLIKTVLCLKNNKLIGQPNYVTPNKHINWESNNIKVVKETIDWSNNQNKPLRAGVSSFGINGVNAHIIVEEFKREPQRIRIGSNEMEVLLLPISAKNFDSLKNYVEKYYSYIQKTQESIKDICYTAAVGRTHFTYRFCAVGKDKTELLQSLNKFLDDENREVYLRKHNEDVNKKLVFVFSGQFSFFPMLGEKLYKSFKAFKEAVDLCALLYLEECKKDLKEILFNTPREKIDMQEQQIVIFVYGYALCKLWESLGVTPSAVIGHGAGEYLAVVFAGVLSVKEAFNLLVNRSSQLRNVLIKVSCAVVFLEKEELLKVLGLGDFNIDIVEINTPNTITISFAKDKVNEFSNLCSARNINYKLLNDTYSLSNVSLTPLPSNILEKLRMAKTNLDWAINTTGEIISNKLLPEGYWDYQYKSTIDFNRGIFNLCNKGFSLFLEIGLETILSTFVKQISNNVVTFSIINSSNQGLEAFYSTLVDLYKQEINIKWKNLLRQNQANRIPVPGYPYNKNVLINEGLISMSNINYTNQSGTTHNIEQPGFQENIEKIITEIVADVLKADFYSIEKDASLLKIGADSFSLISIASRIKKSFEVNIGIRQLFEELNTIKSIANYVSNKNNNFHSLEKINKESKQEVNNRDEYNLKNIYSKYIDNKFLYDAEKEPSEPSVYNYIPRHIGQTFENKSNNNGTEINLTSSLSLRQKEYLASFIKKYNSKTKNSKEIAQKSRSYLANNRKNSSGFRMELKEIHYPIIACSSAESRFTDIDGNQYIDLSLGYGANLFGYNPEFIKKALIAQINKGYQFSPESEYAEKCAYLISQFSNQEKVIFANSGTEAVMTAIRIARAFRKKDKIVIFHNSYHGHYDSTLVTYDSGNLSGCQPVCVGIPKSLVEDTIFLPYNSAQSIKEIIKRKTEIAAVLVEPVQNRQPGLHPKEFLEGLRKATSQNNITLIFDEVLTGFRICAGGAQEWFNINADLVTYGKIIGGGLPIGVIAGKKDHMDMVDGGTWYYGDSTTPFSETTYTAGTFCKHPLALATCFATLLEIKERGPELYNNLNNKSSELFGILDELFKYYNVPIKISNFGSFFRFSIDNNLSFVYQPIELDIFCYHLIEKGLYVWESKTCFISPVHSDDEMNKIIKIVHESVIEMKRGGFWPDSNNSNQENQSNNTEKKEMEDNFLKKVNTNNISTNMEDFFSNTSQFIDKKSSQNKIDFSIYFFGDYKNYEDNNPYNIIINAAKYADKKGFKALWLPERHFNSFGGFSPNPSLISAAVGRETKNLALRGSIVLPLQHPIRVVEEWSVVQHLSANKNVGMAFAPGWQANDFVLNSGAWPVDRKDFYKKISLIQQLWQGKKCIFLGPNNVDTPIETYPKTISNTLPLWLTTLNNKEIYKKAGEIGVGILTNLLIQNINDLKENIDIYKEYRNKSGFDPNSGHVVVLLHTFVDKNTLEAREHAREPFCDYLNSSVELFQKMTKLQNLEVDFDNLSVQDRTFIINNAYERLATNNSLIGDVQECSRIVEKLIEVGVSEVACFLDFGIKSELLLNNLQYLDKLRSCFTKTQEEPYLERQSETEKAIIEINIDKRFPLTIDQSHMLLVEELNEDAKYVNNLLIPFTIEGNINIEALRIAYQELVNNYSSLRTTIEDNEQIIHTKFIANLEIYDISAGNEEDIIKETKKFFSFHKNRVCDLSVSPHRLILLRSQENFYILVINIHHVICDGISLTLFIEGLINYYNDYCEGKSLKNKNILPYERFIEWRLKQHTLPSFKVQEEYWSNVINSGIPYLNLPTDHSRPSLKSYKGSTINISIASITMKNIENIASENNVTVFMTLLAFYAILLRKLTKQEEIVIGVDFSGRTLPGSEESIGYFNNIYPIKIDISKPIFFKELLREIRYKMLEAFENQDYPFGSLINKSLKNRDLSRGAFFSTVFNWDVLAVPSMYNSNINYLNFPKSFVRYDLMLNIIQANKEIITSFEFNTDLFNKETIENFSELYHQLLNCYSADDLISEMLLVKNEEKEEEKNSNNMEDWLKDIIVLPERLEWPKINNRPDKITNNTNTYEFRLNEDLNKKLKTFCNNYDVSLTVVLSTAFKALLYKITKQEDLLIGIRISKLENTLELKNPIFLRTKFQGNESFLDIYKKIKTKLNKAEKDYNLVYDNVISEFNIKNSRNSQDTCQVELCFNIANNIARNKEVLNKLGNLDFKLLVLHDKEDLAFQIIYQANLFTEKVIKRIYSYLEATLFNLLDNPDIRINSFSILSSEEVKTQLISWNNTYSTQAKNNNIMELFEAKAEECSQDIALIYKELILTYFELNQKTNSFSHYLRSIGVGIGDKVAIMVDRTPEMVISILAIIKLGGTYVPIENSFPQERIQYILEDTKASFIISSNEYTHFFDANKLQFININKIETSLTCFPKTSILTKVPANNPVYIIYTSGSTGRPKGVVVDHSSLQNYVISIIYTFNIPFRTKFLYMSTIAADLGNTSFFCSLMSGSELHLLPREYDLNASLVSSYISGNKIDFLKITPSYLEALLNTSNLTSSLPKKFLFLGGELLTTNVANKLLQLSENLELRIINHYGPTETTIGCSTFELTKENLKDISNTSSVPIGKPISNICIYILDHYLNPVPIGVKGEIYITGYGVSQGYLNNPNLTAEKFMPNPFIQIEDKENSNYTRLYKTGDSGLFLENGTIQILARIDDQVKIRGFRVELGEISSILNTLNDILQSTVILKEDELRNKKLVAFIVPKKTLLSSASVDKSYVSTSEEPFSIIDSDLLRSTFSNLRSKLEQILPDYMLPSCYVFLNKLPLTSNGKIDKIALQNIEVKLESEHYEAPQGPLEEKIGQIWSELLGISQISRTDNFFELGGHSLLAMQLISRLRKELKIEITLKVIFEYKNLYELAYYITGHTKLREVLPTISRVSRDQSHPLSFAQQRLWFIEKLSPRTGLYHNSLCFRIEGNLNVPALNKALNVLIERHEVLRTLIINQDASANQKILKDYKNIVLSEYNDEIDYKIFIQKEFKFDKESLFRVLLQRLSFKEYILLFVFHHIIVDGWSIDIFCRELTFLYKSIVKNLNCDLPSLPVQYIDFSVWQRSWLKGEFLKKQLTYWQEKLKNAPEQIGLPTDFLRPSLPSHQGGYVKTMIFEDVTYDLEQFSKNRQSTLFMTCLAAFSILLHRYTQEKDIVIGTPIASRKTSELENVIGFFVNTLPLRIKIKGASSFEEILAQIKNTTLEAYENDTVPFEQLVEHLKVERSLSRHPLFQIEFSLDEKKTMPFILEDVKVVPYDLDEVVSRIDLRVDMRRTEVGFHIGFEYSKDLFKEDTINKISEHFTTLISTLLKNPSQPVGKIDLLLQNEKSCLILWNNNEYCYPKGKTLHGLFEEAVYKFPNAIALIQDNQEITYKALNTLANQLANYLINLGVGPEVPVGIALERSINLIVSILGILKAGGAYIPLDTSYPKERINYMIDDSKVPIIITSSSKLDFLTSGQSYIINLDNQKEEILKASTENPQIVLHPQNLAYIIYTSGSTGNPKGVGVSHESISHLLSSFIDIYQMQPNEAFIPNTSINFDPSVWQIFYPLICGGYLILIDTLTEKNTVVLTSLIKEHKVGLFHSVPSLLFALLNTSEFKDIKNLKTIAGGGESWNLEILKRLKECLPRATLSNVYGPTEGTIHVTHWKHSCNEDTEIISIGRPIWNTQIYILDNYLNELPIGISGQIYIGGIGLARGYINRPELTAERFIPNPFINGERLYRTGDLGRFLPDGNIQFLGRIDDQIKLRGIRIELGEIESIIQSIEQVDKVVALIREDFPQQQKLVVYISTNGDLEEIVNKCNQICNKRLPDFMIPSHIVALRKMPLNANGKIDKKSLPIPQAKQEENCSEPETLLEKKLTAIWKKLLNHEHIGINENFFYLGGHSLLAIQLVEDAKHQGVNIEVKDIFQYSTIKDLAKFVEENTPNTTIDQMNTSNPEVELIASDLNKYILSESSRKYKKPQEKEQMKNALLTGSNGFLGAYLLKELLDKTTLNIFCLIRKKQGSSILERLKDNLVRYGISISEKHWKRIKLIEGDISQKNLGLSEIIWKSLGKELDIIYHNAAHVHHLHSYKNLRDSNVNSTISLLELASIGNGKEIHYISTIGTIKGGSLDELEKSNLLHSILPKNSNGYVLSKWVSEQILLNSSKQGAYVAIYRPGNVTGCSRTGITNYHNNHGLLFLKGCIQLGCAPAWENEFEEMTPVDLIAKAITALSISRRLLPATYNLVNPKLISWKDYINTFTKRGYKMELISPKEWIKKIGNIDENNALFTLRSLYIEENKREEENKNHNKHKKKKIYYNNVYKALAKMDVIYPDNYDNLLDVYLKYLENVNFLTSPETNTIVI